jgi:hypothetical protein
MFNDKSVLIIGDTGYFGKALHQDHSSALSAQEVNEAPRGKPRGIYRNRPNTLSTMGHHVVEAWST